MESSSNDQGWERRRYWHRNTLARIEWWHQNQPQPEGPPVGHPPLPTRDFCYTHGTQIYPTLGCQVCGQRRGRWRP
jgi:hypothetical protein